MGRPTYQSQVGLQAALGRRDSANRRRAFDQSESERQYEEYLQQALTRRGQQEAQSELNRRRSGIEEDYNRARREAIQATPIPSSTRHDWSDLAGKTPEETGQVIFKGGGGKVSDFARESSVRERQGRLAQLDAARKLAIGEKLPLSMRQMIAQYGGAEAQRKREEYKKGLSEMGLAPEEIERKVGEFQRQTFGAGRMPDAGTGQATGVFELPGQPPGEKSVRDMLLDEQEAETGRLKTEAGFQEQRRFGEPMTQEEVAGYMATASDALELMEPQDKTAVEALLNQLQRAPRKEATTIIGTLQKYLDKYSTREYKTSEAQRRQQRFDVGQEEKGRQFDTRTEMEKQKFAERQRQFDIRMEAEKEARERGTPVAQRMMNAYDAKAEVDEVVEKIRSTGMIPQELMEMYAGRSEEEILQALMEAKDAAEKDYTETLDVWRVQHPVEQDKFTMADYERAQDALLLQLGRMPAPEEVYAFMRQFREQQSVQQ